jgi:hypothetical protein
VRLLVTTIIFGVLILGVIVELLRRRRLREKYAALWLFTGFVVVALALFPGGLNSVAVFVGVANGASLALFLAVVFLLIIAMHLSWEVSELEDRAPNGGYRARIMTGSVPGSRRWMSTQRLLDLES